MPRTASKAIDCEMSNAKDAAERAAIKDAANHLRARPTEGFDLLIDNLHLCADPDIAALLVDCATSTGRYDIAEQALRIANDPCGILCAQLRLMQNNPCAALLAIKSRPQNAHHRARFFGLRMRANLMINRYDAAVEAALEWADHTPHSPTPFKVLAKLLTQQDDARALVWSERAQDISNGTPHMLRAV
ncbi:hypothetical protein L0664_03775 [Octadecabacter sp. G9-8]|uniref:Tetratricopeptide repeat protein n=1 Tax=Octadecabacter dasysiphoniae TaxID=2909341 RepID=A0ABS9CT96_9RHOB|nr:hypothetical protein [Octadecabacter dasysiphoniae]MCF2870176.1 hypothetical protein [Octadecabacter dasysiphoniae]